jgi:hypothetical protein
MPDRDLAKRLGRTFYSVQVRRIRRGILMFNNSRKWQPEHFELLGKVSDHELAHLTGRSVAAAKAMRLHHTGVRLTRRSTARPHRPPPEWTEQQKELLKRFRNREVATQI